MFIAGCCGPGALDWLLDPLAVLTTLPEAEAESADGQRGGGTVYMAVGVGACLSIRPGHANMLELNLIIRLYLCSSWAGGGARQYRRVG